MALLSLMLRVRGKTLTWTALFASDLTAVDADSSIDIVMLESDYRHKMSCFKERVRALARFS